MIKRSFEEIPEAVEEQEESCNSILGDGQNLPDDGWSEPQDKVLVTESVLDSEDKPQSLLRNSSMFGARLRRFPSNQDKSNPDQTIGNPSRISNASLRNYKIKNETIKPIELEFDKDGISQ
jgi:hypothetical protein